MVSDRKALALKHVTKARHIVARQRELIAKIRALDGACGHEQELLKLFEKSLAIFEDDLAEISKEPIPV